MPTRYITTDLELTNVADAIRSKGGTSAPLVYPTEFISAINAIQTGGDVPPVEKDVNFIDYDGTLLHSYTKSEIAEMSNENELPANPSHTGLVAQGWNWTLAQIKAQLTAMPDAVPMYVGQMYTTSSGATEIDIEVGASNVLTLYLSIDVNGTVSIDWGDGTTPIERTGTSLSTLLLDVGHTYSATGNYTIKISKISGDGYGIDLSTNSLGLLRHDDASTQASMSRIQRCLNCVKSIRIGADLKKIGAYAFKYCYNLKSITIPNTITNMASSTFMHCNELKSITIPNGVTSIGNLTFQYCYGLNTISIPSGVTSIGTYVFDSCYNLKSITIPSGVTSIGTYAFQNCFGLNTISIPSEVTSIQNSTFRYIYNLTSISIPSGVTSIGTYVFQNCYDLNTISIPSGVTTIGSNAFSGCHSLKSITIPNGVTSIGDSTFNGCYSLNAITIPSEVTAIGAYAFQNCYGLKEIHLLPATPPTLTKTNTFSNLPSDCIIYVPAGKLNDYKTANIWSTWASQMQEEPAT